MKILKFLKGNIVLISIFILALFLRLYDLGHIPVGIHGDEASIGYNAFSLLKTHKDQNGNFLPLVIDQFGDFRPAGYHYLDIPFVAALGLNEWSLRLPSALFGSFMIIAMYFLTLEVFQKKSIAQLATLFLAISPWHIIISRATSEGVVASFFIVIGSFFVLKNLRSEKNTGKYLFLSLVSFSISFLFYHSARLFVPLFLISVFIGFAHIKKYSLRKLKTIGIFSICVFIILAGVFFLSKGANRPTSISILNIPGGNTEVTQQIGEDGHQNALITRILHNKALFYGRIFLYSYFQHLNADFLFNSTGRPVRYSVPWSSVLYLVDLPLLIVGGAILLSDGLRVKKYNYLLPIVWVVIGALPAGLTYEDLPNVQRASLMIPGLLMICAFGLVEIFSLCKFYTKMIVKGLYVTVFLFCIVSFAHNYFYHLPRHEPWHRSAAQKELIAEVDSLQKKYKKVVMTTEGNNNFIFYLFYNAYDPALYQQKGSPKEINGLEFDKVVYYYQKCPLGVDSANPVSEDPEIIFVNKSDCKIPVNTDVLKTINHPDGTPAYYILKVNPLWKPKQG